MWEEYKPYRFIEIKPGDVTMAIHDGKRGEVFYSPADPDEYKICQKRGHKLQPDIYLGPEHPPRCEYCGVRIKTTKVETELNRPRLEVTAVVSKVGYKD